MILALFLACSGTRSAAELPAADPLTVVADAPDAPVAPPPVADGTPISGTPISGTGDTPVGGPVSPTQAYGACRERVELPELAGECTTDADCSKAGCSQEVCVAAVHAPDVMTTCEILPCFAALDTCGCHEGMCAWTVKSEMPPRGRIELPPSMR